MCLDPQSEALRVFDIFRSTPILAAPKTGNFDSAAHLRRDSRHADTKASVQGEVGFSFLGSHDEPDTTVRLYFACI